MARLVAWFNGFLRSIIDAIYFLVHSHGWSIVLFTLLIKVVLLPLDIKSRRSMQRMSEMNPKIQALQKKYANDKEKLQQKQAELYKKEKINPLSGCLPMLLSFPVLIALFAVLRAVANEEIERMLLTLFDAVGHLTDADQVRAALDGLTSSGALHFEPFLWIKNLWMADSPFTSILPLTQREISTLPLITALLDQTKLDAIKAFVDTDLYQTVVLPYFNAVPLRGGSINLLITTLQLFKNPNGYFILPLLTGVTSYLSAMLTPQQDQGAAANPQQQSTGQMMKVFMPLFSLWICATSNAAFALYWLASNVIQMAETFGLTWYFKREALRKGSQAKEVEKP